MKVLSDVGSVEDRLLLLADEAASVGLLIATMVLLVCGRVLEAVVVDAQSVGRGQVLLDHRREVDACLLGLLLLKIALVPL